MTPAGVSRGPNQPSTDDLHAAGAFSVPDIRGTCEVSFGLLGGSADLNVVQREWRE